MNAASKPYSVAPLNSPVRSFSNEDRLQEGVNGIIDAMVAGEGAIASVSKDKTLGSHDGAAEFSCKRLPMMSPTKHLDDTSESSSKDCVNDHMSTTSDASSHKSNHTNTDTMTLKSMLRRSSWNNTTKTVEFQSNSSYSLESVTRQRYARRNSYVSDMVVAQSGTKSEAENADALGYGTEQGGTERKRLQATSNDAPPSKRRRYQRRNSFYIPETSRTSAQASGFSWKAMDFLYGRGETSEKPVASVD